MGSETGVQVWAQAPGELFTLMSRDSRPSTAWMLSSNHETPMPFSVMRMAILPKWLKFVNIDKNCNIHNQHLNWSIWPPANLYEGSSVLWRHFMLHLQTPLNTLYIISERRYSMTEIMIWNHVRGGIDHMNISICTVWCVSFVRCKWWLEGGK